jgi:arsenate reductase
MSITLYGIPNCDTVKKARTWLAEQGIAHEFHDFRKAGVDRALLQHWLKTLPQDVLINRRGTTWRGLPQEMKDGVVDEESAIAVMLQAPSVIKRPVLDRDGALHVGFSAALYQQIFQS